MAITDAQIDDVFARLVSAAAETAMFERVAQHEPKNSPGTGLTYSIWLQEFKAVGRASGLGSVSGLIVWNGRIYQNFRSQPYDSIDPKTVKALNVLLAQYCGQFQLGGGDNVRAIDLLGMYGTPLSAQAGYINIDNAIFRCVTITIPIVFNDLFTESP